jgi:S-adenosylmethionine decarboxylase
MLESVLVDELTGFEGPEKRLEVTFSQRSTSPGMRSICQAEWQSMLDQAKCTIISSTSTGYIDSYVLSESSLFVYDDRIILKTCGTTTLLNCLDKLQELCKKCDCDFKTVIFSRKNFNFPQRQPFPHTNFETELTTLSKKFVGAAHILGPFLTGGDHHYIYRSEHPILDTVEETVLSEDELSDSESPSPAQKLGSTLEILMSQLDPEAMSNFYRNEKYVDAKTTTKSIGLATILPHMITDEVMFEPCGYSVNGISSRDGSYFTVHVTPEPHCSFVSFETNADLSPSERRTLISEVVTIFRPGRFSVVITSTSQISTPKTHIDSFVCKFKTQYQYEHGFHVSMANYNAVKNKNRETENKQ